MDNSQFASITAAPITSTPQRSHPQQQHQQYQSPEDPTISGYMHNSHFASITAASNTSNAPEEPMANPLSASPSTSSLQADGINAAQKVSLFFYSFIVLYKLNF
jgi:hypothetical protein